MSVNFEEGQLVHKDDVLMQIDPRPYKAALDQARGQLAKDQALLADAKLDLQRYTDLIAQNAIPKQQFDTQVATVAQDEGAVKTDQASVEAAQLQLTYSRITSPINGRVGLRLVDPGNIVHAADPNGMLVITQLQPIAVVFTFPEDSLPQVMPRLRSGEKMTVLAYNRDKTQLLATGTLLTVDNEIDPTTGTSKLKAVFDNKENTLFPNQFVNVRLLLETKHNQVIVPAAAIQTGSQGTFVYVVKTDNTVEARPVKVGITEAGNASIETGLSTGDKVVVDGAENIQPGTLVTIETPPANPVPAGQAPAGQTPAGQIPAGQTPTGLTPAGQAPSGVTPGVSGQTSKPSK
jgi:multidrug efflux system membrane fusion protein